MKPHVFHPEADAEYADAAAYYADRGADLGGRFYDEIEKVIAEIDAAPHRFVNTTHPLAATSRETSLTKLRATSTMLVSKPGHMLVALPSEFVPNGSPSSRSHHFASRGATSKRPAAVRRTSTTTKGAPRDPNAHCRGPGSGMISGKTTLIAHIGYPTEAFKAPLIYHPWFEKAGVDAVVVPMGCKPDDYPVFLRALFAHPMTDAERALFTEHTGRTNAPLISPSEVFTS